MSVKVIDIYDDEYQLIEISYEHPSSKEKISIYLDWEEAEALVEDITEIFTHT